MLKRLFSALGITVCLSLALLPGLAKKGEPKVVDGALTFKQQCAGCHADGGNRVNPARPVAGSSKLESIVIFKSYLSAPPGHMPYYKNVVGDRRVLEALYRYCKELKAPPKEARINPAGHRRV